MERPERLSALDSAFLYIESPTAPSHGGYISIMDGPIDFESFRAGLIEKIPRLKRFRQRIQRVPLNLAHPAWVTSPDFNLDDHVHYMEFDPPIPAERADDVLLDLYHAGLDRNKPLWSFHVINGIEGDRAAIVHIMHHCVVDGTSAALFAQALYDLGPIGDGDLSAEGEEMAPTPNAVQSLIHALVDNAQAAVALVKRCPTSMLQTIRALRSPAFREGFAALRENDRAPSIRFPFNGPPSGKVAIAKTSLPFDLMRQLGAQHGGTINDVLLTIVAGGVKRYAEDCGLEIAGKYFKFQMPTNVRLPDQHGKMGNIAAPAPVHVRLDIDDPLERLSAVIERTSTVKRLKVAMGLHYAIQCIQTLMTPPGLILSEKLYGNRRLRQLEEALNRPVGTNMFVTNLPRPRMPLHIGGRKIIHRHVLVPLLPNQRMVCGALTYDQFLEITYTGDAALSPGVETLMRYTVDALDQLTESSGKSVQRHGKNPGDSDPIAEAG